MVAAKLKDDQLIAQNRKARHDYTILDTLEVGIVLTGTEVKSIRQRRVNLKDGFIKVHRGELFLYQVHISPYEQGNIFNHDPVRTRKLLAHKKEIKKLEQVSKESGITLIPLKMYFKQGFVKLLLGVAKGKKQYDKRETLKRRDIDRDIARSLKQY